MSAFDYYKMNNSNPNSTGFILLENAETSWKDKYIELE